MLISVKAGNAVKRFAHCTNTIHSVSRIGVCIVEGSGGL